MIRVFIKLAAIHRPATRYAPNHVSGAKLSSLTRVVLYCVLPLVLAACKHPLSILGQGDILSSSGTRGCSLEEFQAGAPNCAENAVSGQYNETYTAQPRHGWQFDGWNNYCINSADNTCSFYTPANLVALFAGKEMPALEAVFSPAPVPSSLPNVILINVDDMGYSDIAVYGATAYTTPNLDSLAVHGVRFTDFYVAQPQCSASRAGLITGTYPNRIGIVGAQVPNSSVGLHPDETTLGDVFKQMNYRTAVFGKWHLGDALSSMPLQNGFDEFYGIPFSHDFDNVPTYDNETMVEIDSDSVDFTAEYTSRALSFIEQSVLQSTPFFVYLAYPMPHVPLAAGGAFAGLIGAGLYAAVVQEIDAAVGQILSALENHGIEHDTLLLFTSDNGPWTTFGDHAGSADPLREGKSSVYEGGIRVPFIAHWPGVLTPRVTNTPAMNIDILPTVVELIGAPVPALPIDGQSIWKQMTGESYDPSQPAYYFYNFGHQLQGMRRGKWKLIFPHPSLELDVPGAGGTEGTYKVVNITAPQLYDLSNDLEEQHDLASVFPGVVNDMANLANGMRAKLGDTLTAQPCTECRSPATYP